MSGMWGMDTEDAVRFSEAALHAEGVLRIRWDEVDGVVSGLDSFWRGPDADGFAAAWSALRRNAAEAVLERLRGAAEETAQHAEEQELASAGEDGAASSSQPPTGPADDASLPFLPVPGVAFNPGDGETSATDPDIQAAWDEMSEADRKAVLRQIVEDELEAYGLNLDPTEGPMDVEVRFFPGWMNGGAISIQTGMIYLSSDLLDSPYGLQIAAHEARHQAQYEMIRRTDADPWDWITGDDNADKYAEVEEEFGVSREEIEQWRHEFKPWNYEFPPMGDPNSPEYEEQMQAYRDQQVEVDAREREEEFADEFGFEDLQQAQRDAGVPVSQR